MTLFILSGLMMSCGSDYMPKPRAYPRLSLPEASYMTFDSTFPYAFEYSSAARISFKNMLKPDQYWLNIDYPGFKGTIYLSYKKVDGNLDVYLEDAHRFVVKHIPKASAINELPVIYNTHKVYGTIYLIEGISAASACQFYLTDSVNHFLRGSLYFNVVPNNDSLAPAIDFITADIEHLAASLKWK
ncbi:MAG: gliding motility lipoprotein GldD [Bacteroidales bacterium]|nr:gliding motility lipoprotein GldD [Bacteroidales bacterium]